MYEGLVVSSLLDDNVRLFKETTKLKDELVQLKQQYAQDTEALQAKIKDLQDQLGEYEDMGAQNEQLREDAKLLAEQLKMAVSNGDDYKTKYQWLKADHEFLKKVYQNTQDELAKLRDCSEEEEEDGPEVSEAEEKYNRLVGIIGDFQEKLQEEFDLLQPGMRVIVTKNYMRDDILHRIGTVWYIAKNGYVLVEIDAPFDGHRGDARGCNLKSERGWWIPRDHLLILPPTE